MKFKHAESQYVIHFSDWWSLCSLCAGYSDIILCPVKNEPQSLLV